MELQKVKVLFECKNHAFAVLRPEYMLKILAQVDSTHDIEIVPVIEGNKVLAADGKQPAPVDSFVCKRSFKGLVFAKVAIDLNSTIL